MALPTWKGTRSTGAAFQFERLRVWCPGAAVGTHGTAFGVRTLRRNCSHPSSTVPVATVKTYTRKGAKVVLVPSNARLEPMEFDADDVHVFGKVVTVLRRL